MTKVIQPNDVKCNPPKVKPLVWVSGTREKHLDCMEYSETAAGTYFIMDDNDDFTGLFCDFVTIRDVTWFGTGNMASHEIMSGVREDKTATLRAAAQADHERRILDALE